MNILLQSLGIPRSLACAAWGSRRISLAIVLGAFGVGNASAQFPGPVSYTPKTKIIQGNQPLLPTGTVPDAVAPINPYTLSIKSPTNATYPVTVNLGVSITKEIGTNTPLIPAGVSEATAVGF